MADNFPNTNPSAYSDPFTAINQIIQSYLADYVFTCIPVEVVALNADNRFVNLKPILQNKLTTGEIIPITDDDIYYNVPMMTIFGNGCEISILTSTGDRGLLIGSKYDISNYKKTHEVSPVGSSRTFSFSDGFFLPLDFQTKQDGVIVRNQNTVLHLLPESITMTTTQLTAHAQQVVVNAETVEVNATTATTNAESVAVNAKTVSLGNGQAGQAISIGGGGGKGLARVGDTIEVEVLSGSSAGTWQGVITSGSGVATSV